MPRSKTPPMEPPTAPPIVEELEEDEEEEDEGEGEEPDPPLSDPPCEVLPSGETEMRLGGALAEKTVGLRLKVLFSKLTKR